MGSGSARGKADKLQESSESPLLACTLGQEESLSMISSRRDLRMAFVFSVSPLPTTILHPSLELVHIKCTMFANIVKGKGIHW